MKNPHKTAIIVIIGLLLALLIENVLFFVDKLGDREQDLKPSNYMYNTGNSKAYVEIGEESSKFEDIYFTDVMENTVWNEEKREVELLK